MEPVSAVVVHGHGVASGVGGDPRFPDGTLGLQFPIFTSLGLDLDGFHIGTINLSITPVRYKVIRPRLTLADVKWHPDCPAETFSFFDCKLFAKGEPPVSALIYRPHPETKPEHFQADDVLEVLAPNLPDIDYGQTIDLLPDPAQLQLLS